MLKKVLCVVMFLMVMAAGCVWADPTTMENDKVTPVYTKYIMGCYRAFEDNDMGEAEKFCNQALKTVKKFRYKDDQLTAAIVAHQLMGTVYLGFAAINTGNKYIAKIYVDKAFKQNEMAARAGQQLQAIKNQ